MESTFKLSALGVQPGQDSQTVRARLQPMMKSDAADFNNIFHRISLNQLVVLGENIPKDKAENLLKKLTAIGLKCRLDPMALSLVPIEEAQQSDVYRCPSCGYTQSPARGGKPNICERCGVVGENYETVNELKQALEMERRRLRSALDKEKKEKLEAKLDKANQQREKAQQEVLERARRQAEKELGIGPLHQFKALLKPGILYPILGGLAVGLIGVGLLIWQLGDFTEDVVASAELAVVGESPQATQDGAGLAPGAAQSAVAPPATANTAAKASSAAPAADKPGAATATTTTASQASAAGATSTTGSGPAADKPAAATAAAASPVRSTAAGATSASDAKAVAQTAFAVDVNQLALVLPADRAASDTSPHGVARNPQLLARLAQYQIQIGDLAAATRSIDQAVEILGTERGNLSSRQLDVLNRAQAEIRAEIANRHHQRQDLATAQSFWFRAINLANSITTPSERALALSGVARTMKDAQASATEDYFRRSMAALPLIAEPSSQALTLGAIARDLAQTGHPEQSEALFEQAAAAVKAIRNPEGQLLARTILAKQHAEAGNIAMAQSLLAQVASAGGGQASLEPSQHQVEARSAIALSLANQGDTTMARANFSVALEKTPMLKDPALRAETLLYLARDVAAAGDREAAAKLAAAAGPWD